MAIAVGIVVVAGVAAIAVSTISQRRSEAGRAETRSVSVSGEKLPPQPKDGSQSDPAVGMQAPTISGESFDGTPISIAPDDKAKVVVFLAHWCPHCQAEVPRLVEWMRENPPPSEVSVIGVSTGVNRGASNYPPSRWLEREGWSAPVIADDENSSAGKAFGVEGYPTFVVISKDGKVLGRMSGEVSKDQWLGILLSAASTTKSA